MRFLPSWIRIQPTKSIRIHVYPDPKPWYFAIIFILSCPVSRAYSPAVLDLSKLLILAGRTCWILYVDILVLGKGQYVVYSWPYRLVKTLNSCDIVMHF
jgi:hypothetical protein